MFNECFHSSWKKTSKTNNILYQVCLVILSNDLKLPGTTLFKILTKWALKEKPQQIPER